MGIKANALLYLVLVIGLVIACGVLIASFYCSQTDDVMLKLAIARTLLSAITIPIVLVGFFYNTIQFRKASAKPSINVAFNEKEAQETMLIFQDLKPKQGLPLFWIFNHGEAIAKDFQIDFFIPKEIANSKTAIHPNEDNDCFIFPYIYAQTNPLWVNRPYQERVTSFSSYIDYDKVYELSNPNYKIEYRIYGNWKIPQKGTLKVIVKKQETSNAAQG